jgi:hypothetical protein
MLPLAYTNLKTSIQVFNKDSRVLSELISEIDANASMAKTSAEIGLWRTLRAQATMHIVMNEERDEDSN